MLRVPAETAEENAATGAIERKPLWWYARVIRRLCPAGGRLLECGCGDGQLLQYLVSDFETFGYDDDPMMRHRCRTAVPDAVVLEDLEAIEPETCDVVVAIDGLRGRKPLGALRAMEAKLAAGGLLFLVTPNSGGLAHRLKGRNWFARDRAEGMALLSRGEWVTLMRKAKLQIVDIESDGLWDAPYLPLIPAMVQRAVCDVPSVVQGLWPISRSLLPAALGECLLITARKGS
jgi:hypothetical protein